MSTEQNTVVILAYGPQPVSFLADASKLAGKDAVISSDVARMAGANFAVGNLDQLAKLRARLEEGAQQQERAANPGLSEAATRWLAGGHRGISSNMIFTRLTGIDAMSGWGTGRHSYPQDPADFRRCQLLLEQLPELQPLFQRMAEVGPEWAELVAAWPTIIAAMDREVPGWRDGRTSGMAHEAYGIIKRAIGR